MTPKNTAPAPTLKTVIANMKRLEAKMDECRVLFEQNAAILSQLTPDAPAPVPNEVYTPVERSILAALSTLMLAGVREIPRGWLAVAARLRPKSSMYSTALAALLDRGSIMKIRLGWVAMVDGQTPIDHGSAIQLDLEELMDRASGIFKPQEMTILRALSSGAWLERKALAEMTSQSFDSSTFRDRLRSLRAQGFIAFGPNQTVRTTLEWFMPFREKGRRK